MPHVDWHAPTGNGKDFFLNEQSAPKNEVEAGKNHKIDSKNITEPSEVGEENTKM